MIIGHTYWYLPWFFEEKTQKNWKFVGMTKIGNYELHLHHPEHKDFKWTAIRPENLTNYEDLETLKEQYPERFI